MKISDNNEFEIWTDKAMAHGFGQQPRSAHECKPLQSLLMMRASRDAQEAPIVMGRSVSLHHKTKLHQPTPSKEDVFTVKGVVTLLKIGRSIVGMP